MYRFTFEDVDLHQGNSVEVERRAVLLENSDRRMSMKLARTVSHRGFLHFAETAGGTLL